MSLFINAILRLVDLINGLGSRIIDLGGQSGLPNAESFFVDQLDKQAPLLVGHR